jgi:hypothetical protein
MAGRLMALPARPKLLVLVIVEQFRPDYLDFAASSLASGGFRRLLDKGAFFPDCRHLASTFPASSIATLATGAWPAQHGIAADSWYDRSIRKAVPASDEALLATSLASQVVAEPANRVTIVSLNEPHGALFAGTPDARLFSMDETGQFSTPGDPPDWLAAFNVAKNPAGLHGARWLALGAKPDAPALRTLTFSPSHPAEFLALYKSSPFAQDAQFDLAMELIDREKLGQGGTFDFLCILAGSTGLLGYETGALSPLMRQMTLRLDQKIESLLNQLAKAPGEKNFSFVIVGAHGAPPEPATDMRDRMAVSGETVAQAVDRYLHATGSGRVEKYVYPFLYLDTSGFRDPEPVRQAAARAAMDHPAVAGYFTAGGACSTHDEWERRFRNSFHPVRSGDVILSYQPEYIEDYSQGRGISYGSLYNYDVQAPLVFYGPQFRPGVFEAPVESVDVAPTLARAIGVAAPSSSTGRVLGEALVE